MSNLELLTESQWVNELLQVEQRLPWYTRNSKPIPLNIQIIEDIIGNKLSLIFVASKYGVTYEGVKSILIKYYEKPKYGLCIMSNF